MPEPIPTKKCADCGGLVIVGGEKFHLCPGPRRDRRTSDVVVADGTRGMERGR